MDATRSSDGMSSHDPIVALTREDGSNQKLRVLLESKNIKCIEIPCIAFAAGKDIHKLEEEILNNDIIVISSPQAADVFLEAWAKLGKPSVKVATVGKGTSKPLQQKGKS
jgi:uroporphyrinogen-III synthase